MWNIVSFFYVIFIWESLEGIYICTEYNLWCSVELQSDFIVLPFIDVKGCEQPVTLLVQIKSLLQRTVCASQKIMFWWGKWEILLLIMVRDSRRAQGQRCSSGNVWPRRGKGVGSEDAWILPSPVGVIVATQPPNRRGIDYELPGIMWRFFWRLLRLVRGLFF